MAEANKAPVAKQPSLEPIESVVVKKFYAPNNQMMEVGQPYVYSPDENEDEAKRLPYPWPLLRPQNKSLEKELSKEYFDWKAIKDENINLKADGSGGDAILQLAKLLGKLSKEN